jgi:hypothetical protein
MTSFAIRERWRAIKANSNQAVIKTRVNPASTREIATGKSENKFGIPIGPAWTTSGQPSTTPTTPGQANAAPCGAVQAGTYNTRPLVAEVMVNGNLDCILGTPERGYFL